MEQLKTFFFDTYAFYEIIVGNSNYEKYKKDVVIITTKLNLMELHYGLLRTEGKEKADEKYDSYIQFAVEITDPIVKMANEFRLQNKEKKLSYVDCLGYTLAKAYNVRFLTGDMQFENMENVEFVK
ncbi:MAG: PIN domain-containing protein [Nanoarchaeota archaeon]